MEPKTNLVPLVVYTKESSSLLVHALWEHSEKELFLLYTGLTTRTPVRSGLIVFVDNDRGDSPRPYRARVFRADAPELPPGTPWMHARWHAVARDVMLSQSARGGMTRC